MDAKLDNLKSKMDAVLLLGTSVDQHLITIDKRLATMDTRILNMEAML